MGGRESAEGMAPRVALVGDVALDVVAPYFRAEGFETYVPAGFGTWRQELLDEGSGLCRFNADFTFDVTAHDAALSEEVPGFFDERMCRLAAMPYSLAGIRAIVEEFGYFRLAGPKKVLAVDADNTLWRGILSEDGRDSLVECTTFQRGLSGLRAAGVTLVLLSKNDGGEGPFIREDMTLGDADFAVRRVNWSPKPGNLIEACRELNVGLDSVVFVDDNAHERAQMSAHLPEVTVAPWNGWSDDPAAAEREARSLVRRLGEYFFSGMGATDEDRLRAASYAARAAALATRAEFRDAGEYLASLDLRVEARDARPADIERLAQMAGKTNQFNATTIRRGRAEFEALLADGGRRVFVFRTSDRFGEQGIVCYVVADLAARRITDFVMSCRAMGRTLEHFAYGYVSSALGFAPEVDFVRTVKNRPFEEFLVGLRPGMKTYYKAAGPRGEEREAKGETSI